VKREQHDRTDGQAEEPAARVVRPVAVSQLTSEPILGVDARRFLRLLRQHPELPRARVGKLVIVPLAALERLLWARSETETNSPGPTPASAPEDVDAVLEQLGKRRTLGARR